MPAFTARFGPIAFWLVMVLLIGSEFRQSKWECLLVMFAALELIPQGLRLLGLPQKEPFALAAAAFCAAYFVEGYWFFALPYLFYAIWLTVNEAAKVGAFRKKPLLHLVRVFALAYWFVGALFAVFFLSDFAPLDFDAVIVSLTAAHFHVAGFVLSTLVFCLLRENHSRFNQFLGGASLLGMPLVALGITLTHGGFPPALEQASALVFVAYALGVVVQQIRLFSRPNHKTLHHWLWLVGSLFLLAGMALAATYTLRFQFPLAWFNIPNLKIWHGTMNTLGFAWLSLLAWDAAHQNAR